MTIYRADERFVLDGVNYEFMLAPQNQAFNSTSPFAQKAVIGERSLADYDTESVVAFSDLSGGIGQEKLTDPAMYQSGSNIDTRGGLTLLGPLIHTASTNPLLPTMATLMSDSTNAQWFSIDSTRQRLVVQLPLSSSEDFYLDRVWLPLSISGAAEEVVITIRGATPDGPVLAICEWDRQVAGGTGGWLECRTGGITVNGPVYVMVQHRGEADAVRWYGGSVAGEATNAQGSSSTWIGSGSGPWHNIPPFSSLRYHLNLIDGLTPYADVSAAVTRGTGNSGVAAAFDIANNPNNGLLAFHDGTNMKLDKVLAGVRTTLLSAVTPYVAGGVVELFVASIAPSGCTIDITAVSGVGGIEAVTIAAGGTGYHVGDILTVEQGGSGGGSTDGTLAVTGLTGTAVSSVNILTAGTAYTTGTAEPTSSNGASAMYAQALYDGTPIGASQLITDAGIVGNSLHGLYSTTSTNYLNSVSIVLDGSDTAVLDTWIQNTLSDLAAGAVLIYQALEAGVSPDGPLMMLPGAGEDGIPRIWGYSGRYLYYLDEDGVPTVVEDGSGNPYRTTADILDAVWFRKPLASYPSLYLALGDAEEMVAFNGNIGAEDWEPQVGIGAHALAVHDAFLWRADERNQVSGSLDGIDWGDETAVGDSTYLVKNLISWNNALWAGKQDGIYKITYTDGYPIDVAAHAVLALDLSALVHPNNCKLFVVHQSDLYFSLLSGVTKFTASGVVVPSSPEITLDAQLSTRGMYETAVSSMTALWVGNSGAIGKPSSFMAYVDGSWTSLATMPQLGDRITSMVVDPGWYGDSHRIWWSTPFGVHYVRMPLNTLRRWLDDDMDYAASGVFTTSWIDGNLATVGKHWSKIELMLEGFNNYADVLGEVSMEYRMFPSSAWTYFGGVSGNGMSTINLPTGTHGKRIQFRITITPDTWTIDGESFINSPRIVAMVLRYVERPDDARGFSTVYLLSSDAVWANGTPVGKSVSDWLVQLQTLREARAPLTYFPAWANEGSFQVHLVDYGGPIQKIEDNEVADRFEAIVTVRLQVV